MPDRGDAGPSATQQWRIRVRVGLGLTAFALITAMAWAVETGREVSVPREVVVLPVLLLLGLWFEQEWTDRRDRS